MAKGQQSQATKLAGTMATGAQTQLGQNIYGGGAFGSSGLSGMLSDAKQQATNALTGATQGYTQAQKTGGYDPGMLATLRSNTANLASTGGYDPATLAKLRGSLDTASASGGYDPSMLSYLRTQGTNFSETGGYDPEAIEGYRSFAKTGGFSDQDVTNYLNRATSGVTGTYNTLAAEQARRRAATGGLGGGGDEAQMARQLTQAQADATLGAQTSLQQQINANKLSGLGGLGQVASAKEAALSGLGSLEGNVAAGSRDITNQQAALEGSVASGIRSGVGAQTALEGGVAQGSLAGTQGLANLYNTATGQVTSLGQQALAAMGLSSADQATALSALTSLSKNPGAYDTFLRTLGLFTSSEGG